jgi:phosphatidylglycerophosphate synthase
LIKQKIPLILIYSRLLLAAVIIILSAFQPDNYKYYAVAILITGLLTDVFDGIIARQLKVSTVNLRRLDSTIDQIFFIAVALATYIQCPSSFKQHKLSLIVLFSSEVLIYLVSYIKFKKEIATHTIGAKFWTLILCATLIQIMLTCQSNTLYWLCMILGLITRAEIVLIILTLKNWTNDVPTLYHAVQLRRGIEIKRNKLFNG